MVGEIGAPTFDWTVTLTKETALLVLLGMLIVRWHAGALGRTGRSTSPGHRSNGPVMRGLLVAWVSEPGSSGAHHAESQPGRPQQPPVHRGPER